MIAIADLKAYLGGEAGSLGVDETAVLTALEVRAVALVERATGRFFGASESHTYYLEGNGETSIFLPDDVTAVASVSYQASPLETATALTLTTGYVVRGREIVRTDGEVWPLGWNTVIVVATRGYATDAEPGPIRQLVLDLVNWQYRAGRKLALADEGSPDVAKVTGWDRTIQMYREPLYG